MGKAHVLLIHGTWCNGGNWGEFATELQRRGFTVHSPTLRHHGGPGADLPGDAEKVAKVGLLDYVADPAELVETLDNPPINCWTFGRRPYCTAAGSALPAAVA